ncbi:hypothetical protein COO60DRAFT_1195509 [Scenedesmus sp. NREL 46B-D3]|nr:hypothetical protein COO60DRAFT_1195509 [Scenedesmus sp. NREL 46B-D3]
MTPQRRRCALLPCHRHPHTTRRPFTSATQHILLPLHLLRASVQMDHGGGGQARDVTPSPPPHVATARRWPRSSTQTMWYESVSLCWLQLAVIAVLLCINALGRAKSLLYCTQQHSTMPGCSSWPARWAPTPRQQPNVKLEGFSNCSLLSMSSLAQNYMCVLLFEQHNNCITSTAATLSTVLLSGRW